MPNSFYEGDLHVLEIEKKLREAAHRKLDKLEEGLAEVQRKVEDARERLPARDQQSTDDNSCSRDGT